MRAETHSLWRSELELRRTQLSRANELVADQDVARLLVEVESALERLRTGKYGICNKCLEPIETESLMRDPLVRVCLECLSQGQRRELERDLEVAAQIQAALLPERLTVEQGWEIAFDYEPLGPVSGDHCDLIRSPSGKLYFLFGDVAGKGVSGSMLMAHLHALFRSLVQMDLPLQEMLGRANRLFCESTLPSSYVTLVAGTLVAEGSVELSNAGHVPAYVLSKRRVQALASNGLPFGLFPETEFHCRKVELAPGDALFLHTDGVTEARNEQGEEYGPERVVEALLDSAGSSAWDIVQASLARLKGFTRETAGRDDRTMMVVLRTDS